MAAVSTVSITSRRQTFGGKSWADVDVELDLDNQAEFPALDPAAQKEQDEKDRKERIKILNQSLSKKRQITITRGNYSRTLRVCSKQTYDNLLQLIGRFKSHDKTGRLNYREQKDKIKYANNLLQTIYKVSREPEFVYHVAIIHLNDGRDLVRDEIAKDSRAPFTLEERYADMS